MQMKQIGENSFPFVNIRVKLIRVNLYNVISDNSSLFE